MHIFSDNVIKSLHSDDFYVVMVEQILCIVLYIMYWPDTIYDGHNTLNMKYSQSNHETIFFENYPLWLLL